MKTTRLRFILPTVAVHIALRSSWKISAVCSWIPIPSSHSSPGARHPCCADPIDRYRRIQKDPEGRPFLGAFSFPQRQGPEILDTSPEGEPSARHPTWTGIHSRYFPIPGCAKPDGATFFCPPFWIPVDCRTAHTNPRTNSVHLGCDLTLGQKISALG